MHTLVFRSCDVILEVDDARLIEDVCFDLEKAEKKLISARRQLVNVRERAAEEIRKLTAKLGAAVDAARRSDRSESVTGSGYPLTQDGG